MFNDLVSAALDVTFDIDLKAVDVTVTRPEPDALPFSTRGIWNNTPQEETQPFGADRAKKDPRRVMDFRRDLDTPEIVRGSIVLAPERDGASVKRWRVDGFERAVEVDLIRVLLVELP